jgi:hypothetical protein
MNKKYILPIALLTLISLAVFVSATLFREEDNLDGSVSLNKGWNLVTIYATKLDNDNSNFEGKDIRAAFFYDKYYNRYVQIYPNREEQKLNEFVLMMGDPEEGGNIKEYGAFTNSAMWIYSDKAQTLNFRTLDGPLSMKNVQLSSGWNFLTITPEMIGQTLKEMKGDCDWEKIYAWEKEAGESQWLDLLNNPNFVDREEFTNNMLWKNLVIKVSNDCTMGGSSVTPPTIPN